MDRISYLQVINDGNGIDVASVAKQLGVDEAAAIEALKGMVAEKTIRTMECGTLVDSLGFSGTSTVVSAIGAINSSTRFFMTVKGKGVLVVGSYLPELLGTLYSSAQSRISASQKGLPPAASKDDDILG